MYLYSPSARKNSANFAITEFYEVRVLFTRRRVLALVLLVEAVDATVRTAEVSVGVRDLLHAGDLAEQLAPRRHDRTRGGLDVVHPEAESDAAVV